MKPRLFFLLSTAQRAVQRRTAHNLVGITGSQVGVLFLLGSTAGATIGDVARGMEATPSSMTELVDRMAVAGLVVRHPDPDDERSQRLTLTAAGEAARLSAVAQVAEMNALMTDGFSAADVAVVARWLDAVRSRFAMPSKLRGAEIAEVGNIRETRRVRLQGGKQ